MLRSAAAILTGFVVIAALALGTSAVVRALLPGAFDATGRTDSAPVLLLTLGYVAAFAIFGCYLAARLAPREPMRHALILGVLGLAFTGAGTAAAWETAPAWYHATSLALVLPFAWVGGRLRERELSRAPARARASLPLG